jgi:hypothetical protein
MKTGSLVECIRKNPPYAKYIKPETPYTVLEIIKKGDIVAKGSNGFEALAGEDGIRLVEVYTPDVYWDEYDIIIQQLFPMADFRELVPCGLNVEEFINENLITIKEPELV